MAIVYNTRTSLAAYVDALYSPYLKAVSRILSDSNGYLQQLASQAQAAVTSASQSASSAEQSAQTASTAASNALSDYNKTNVLFVSFGKTWYGDLPSDPTDNPNTGGPLNIGARYWNTTDNKIRIYTSTGWQDYDAQAEQLQQEASISAAQAAKSASEAQAASNAATAAANAIQADVIQIQKDLSELEELFTFPLPANEIPQVNSTGTGFDFVPSNTLGGIEFNYHRVQYPYDYDDFYLRAPGPKDPFYNGTQWNVYNCSGEGPWNGFDSVPVPPATDKLSKFIRY